MRVEWTPLAIEHLKAAFEYLAERNLPAAEGVVERILDAVDRIEQHPEMGRPGRIEDTRELVIPRTPFLVAYRLRGNKVDILSVLHAARRWPEQL